MQERRNDNIKGNDDSRAHKVANNEYHDNIILILFGRFQFKITTEYLSILLRNRKKKRRIHSNRYSLFDLNKMCEAICCN